MKYIKVVFTNRPMSTFGNNKEYTYSGDNADVAIGDMVVAEVGDEYAIAQVSGFTDTISFDPDKLRDIVGTFNV